MLHSEAIELVVKAEDRFPVADWTVDGIHVWPLVRIALGDALTLDAYLDSTVTPFGKSIATRVAGKVRSGWTYLQSRLGDRQRNARPDRAVTALFLSTSLVRCCVDGSWYDRLCWPLISCLASQGHASLLLEQVGRRAIPRAHASWYTNATHARAAWRARMHHREGAPPDVRLERYEDFLTWLSERHAGASSALGHGWLFRCMHEIRELSRRYREVLSATRPRFAFLVCFSSLQGFAMSHACRAEGVMSVDLQHGLGGDRMYPYSAWTKMPAAGFSLLPRAFLCWSEIEADLITGWSARTPGAPTALVGGNMWLRNFEAEFGDAARRSAAELQAVRSRDGSKVVVLYLAQAERQTPAHVLEAIRSSPAGVSWWYRQHPADASPAPDVAARLMASTGRRVEVSRPTELPLPSVLGSVDLVVSRYSAAILDASDVGKEAVVISPEGADLFACYKPRVRISEALVAAELAARIHRSLERPPGPHPREPVVDVAAVLGELEALRRRLLDNSNPGTG